MQEGAGSPQCEVERADTDRADIDRADTDRADTDCVDTDRADTDCAEDAATGTSTETSAETSAGGSPSGSPVGAKVARARTSGCGKQGWTPEEDEHILAMVGTIGSKWSKVAVALEGRTDDAVRNRYLRLKRKAPS